MRRIIVLIAVAAIVVAAVVLGVLVATSGSSHNASAAESARAFVTAWKRSLEGTWTVEGTSVRAGLRDSVKISQRPPDRLVRRGQAVSGTVNGRDVSCVVDPTGEVRCHDGGAARAYATTAAQQVADLTSEVGGPAPLYLVSDDGGGCFGLRLALVVAAPPYGQSARFCFDATTGAPTLQQREVDGVIDQESFPTVSPAVTETALSLPAPLEK